MLQSVVACGDAAEVLDPPEHALNGVSVTVKRRGEAGFPAPVYFWRNVWRCPPGFDFFPHGIGVVALVAVQHMSCGHLVQQEVSCRAVGDLAAGQQEGDGAAETVGQGMYLRRTATS